MLLVSERLTWRICIVFHLSHIALQQEQKYKTGESNGKEASYRKLYSSIMLISYRHPQLHFSKDDIKIMFLATYTKLPINSKVII